MDVPLAGLLGHRLEDEATIIQQQVLYVLSARVRAAAPDNHAAVGVVNEWLDRVAPTPGVDSRGVELVDVEERLRIKAGGVTDVATLGVGDNRDVLRHRA